MKIPDYTVIRSKRRTISLQIKPDLQVVVRCPNRMPTKQVELFVQQHAVWLEKNFSKVAARQEQKSAFSYSEGEVLYLLGTPYVILADSSEGALPRTQGENILYSGQIEDRAAATTEFYRRMAKEYLPERVKYYSEQMGLVPKTIKITSAATRWGSCGSNGGICFSWRLMCLPTHLVDYVVVHELAHLREHNHSSQFYRIVETVVPNYRFCRKEMKEWQARLPI